MATGVKMAGNRATGARLREIAAVALLLLPPRPADAKGTEELAVIVHPDNKTDAISISELRAIFRRDIKRWREGGKTIVPFNWKPRHPVRVLFDRWVLKKTPDQVAEFWINQRIRGRGRPPRFHSSPRIVLSFVAHERRAISYIPVRLLGSGKSGVKVLRVEGRAPGQKEYPLRGN
jgi:ABC-type phosphate transport system substrate-binding protein